MFLLEWRAYRRIHGSSQQLFLLCLGGISLGRLTGGARTRRPERRSGKRKGRRGEYSRSRISLCRTDEQRLSFAAARHEKNKVKFIRLPPKRCAPLGEKCPKFQGVSPIRKSFTRVDAPRKNAANRVGHNIAGRGLRAC